MKLFIKILIRTILSFVTLIVGTLLVITLIFAFNSKRGEITYLFGVTGFINTGTSMVPKIDPGDLVLVKKQDSYNKSDIISFISPDNYITTHRIVNINGPMYETKGDSNNFIDGALVQNKDIYGKVILIIPGVGRFLNFINNYGVYLIIIVLLIGIALPIIKWRKHVR